MSGNILHECVCSECHIGNKQPDLCPITAREATRLFQAIKTYREDSFARKVFHAHSRLLGRGSSKWPRSEHIREFCVHMGIMKAGLACCSMFLREARTMKAYLAEKGIQGVVVCCKIGAIRLKDISNYRSEMDESIVCNSVGQAKLLNHHKTEINVLLGLCAPHDMIFSWYSEAPSTTLFTKEHLSNHAPYHTLLRMTFLDS